MNRQCKFSNVTKNYLTEFNDILNRMILGMTNAEFTDSISHNFIVQMIPHHMAAIEMSKNILKYTTNIPLQDIALEIVKEQTKSIENMREAECQCDCVENSDSDLCLYQKETDNIMHTMFDEMDNAIATNRIDCDFMREMIPHHRGAIRMSKNALRFDICPQLKPILCAIISSQQKGIARMTNLLHCIGCN